MCYKVRDGLRCVSEPRIRACGFAVVAERVSLVVSESGAARWGGLAHCGSVWACAVCRARICAKRRAEVTKAVEAVGADNCAMLTLTIRHGAGDDLARLRAGLADAWRGMTRGKSWKLFARRVGLQGYIRALEVTHGPNGWHPHLHVLLLLDAEPPHMLDESDTRDRRAVLADEAAWLQDRWCAMVERYLGAEQTPRADGVGCKLTPIRDVDYIAKLGLELADAFTKRGKEGHRTPFQIAADFGRWRRPRDGELWRTWCTAMLGARHLTWSRGLKDALDIRERSDADLCEDEALEPTDKIVATVPAADWLALRKTEGASVALLEALEAGGVVLFGETLSRMLEAARPGAA